MTSGSQSLTAAHGLDLKDLERLEGEVRNGMEGFRRAAKALREIHDRRLYQAIGYNDFKHYCDERIDGKRMQAYRILKADEIFADIERHLPALVSPMGDTVIALPINERQVRPLQKIKEPSERAVIWKKATEESDGKIPTEATVRDIVAEVGGKLSPQGKAEALREKMEANEAAAKAREAREHVATLNERLDRGTDHLRLGSKQYAHLPDSEELIADIATVIEKAKGRLAGLN